MDAVRYYVALLMLAFVPPGFLFWFSIHPFIRFWRRMGVRITLGLHYAALLVIAGLSFVYCKPLLSIDFGTNPILVGVAVPLLVSSAILRKRLSAHLRLGILTGLPELAPEHYTAPLLTEGIYARMRHPRYVQILMGITAYALFCNYLATYVLVLTLAVIVDVLVRLEERELRKRFGAEYESYRARVPRFVPRLHR